MDKKELDIILKEGENLDRVDLKIDIIDFRWNLSRLRRDGNDGTGDRELHTPAAPLYRGKKPDLPYPLLIKEGFLNG